MKLLRHVIVLLGLVAIATVGLAHGADINKGGTISYTPRSSDYSLSKEEAKPENDFCLSVVDITYIECKALEDLYNATDGSNRVWNYNWLIKNKACEWFGVECDQSAPLRHITILRLPSNNLNGTIPNTISNLFWLTRLELYRNNIHGTIPPSIGNLSELRALVLSYNQLNGTIPANFGNLPSIVSLALDNNQLNGTIPAYLGNASTLVGIWLNSNNLNGPMPTEFKNLYELRVLRVENNNLNGEVPNIFDNLNNLRYLDISNNRFCGLLPESLMETAIEEFSGIVLTNLLVHNNYLFSDGYSQAFTNRLDERLGYGRQPQLSSQCSDVYNGPISCQMEVHTLGGSYGKAQLHIAVYENGIQTNLPLGFQYHPEANIYGPMNVQVAIDNLGNGGAFGLIPGYYTINGSLIAPDGKVIMCRSAELVVDPQGPIPPLPL